MVSMTDAESGRRTAGALAWIVRLVLVVATFVLLRYGSQLLTEWQNKRRANFTFYPWEWLAALAIVCLAGVVFAMASRFPFPRPRFAWGRLLIALLILVPALHTTLIFSGWIDEADLVVPELVVPLLVVRHLGDRGGIGRARRRRDRMRVRGASRGPGVVNRSCLRR